MSIKTTFSIKDLENLSGIKAHTIRIWERRYNLLEPMRSDTNIRSYDNQSLQKLLNVNLLIENGYKISKIAEIPDNELYALTRELLLKKESPKHTLDTLKLATLNFDRILFDQVYNQLLEKHSFRDIFLNILGPFLNEVGMLWLTKTITPAHEHFISNLIKQKVLTNIEKVQHLPIANSKTCVLFLPLNEIHELALMYIHFELLLKGYNSIYLGQSVPTENLIELQYVFDKIEFVSYFTVEPNPEDINSFLADFDETILSKRKENLHILGKNATTADLSKCSSRILQYNSIESLLKKLN